MLPNHWKNDCSSFVPWRDEVIIRITSSGNSSNLTRGQHNHWMVVKKTTHFPKIWLLTWFWLSHARYMWQATQARHANLAVAIFQKLRTWNASVLIYSPSVKSTAKWAHLWQFAAIFKIVSMKIRHRHKKSRWPTKNG